MEKNQMCDCIDRVNANLAQFNTIITVPMWTSTGMLTPFVETSKLDTGKRGKPRSVFASHCPFCGEKYVSQQERTSEEKSEHVEAEGPTHATRDPDGCDEP